MRTKKKKKLKERREIRYIPLDDLKEIDEAFLTEMLNVKQKLSVLKDPEIIKAMHGNLLSAYNAAVAIKTYEREVDYDIQLAKIDARADELRPERRHHWYWLFRTFPNRAQDIIEERAELDAERVHSELEKLLDDDWARLFPKKDKLSKRELRRQAKKQLKAAIKKADETPTNEAFDEPAEPKEPEMAKKFSIEEIEQLLRESVDEVKVKSFAKVWDNIKDRINAHKDEQKQVENVEKQEAEKDEPAKEVESTQTQPRRTKQLPGQIKLDDIQPQENADKPAQGQLQAIPRRPRPPRSCRKP